MKRIVTQSLSLLILLTLTACSSQGAVPGQNTGVRFAESASAKTDARQGKEVSVRETNQSNQKELGATPVFDFETKTVRLNSGYEMPIAGLGTYALSNETCISSVNALLESGGRLIDTASFYGTEKSVGEAIRNSSVPREEIFVTTKLYPNQFSNPEEAIDESLEMLDIGYNRMKQNFDVFGFTLSIEDMEQIKAMDIGHSEIVNHFDPQWIKLLHTLKF